jgi:hypothetical protein
MSTHSKELAERIAKAIQEETFADGNYEIPSSPEAWLKDATEVAAPLIESALGEHLAKDLAARDAAISELVRAAEMKIRLADMDEEAFDKAYRGENYSMVMKMIDQDFRKALAAYKAVQG